ncbi:MAG: hypothetical protein ACM3JB_19855 [Acidobacteriaceae bacterium]
MTLEDRVALLEATVTEMESRRRKLIPPELEKNENVQAVIKDCLKGYYEKMQDFAGQRRLDEATTERNRLAAEARYELEQAEKKELARDVEAIRFYEEHGYAPVGYEFTERVEE